MCIRRFVYRLSHDCHIDIDRDVSTAYCRPSSGDSVDFLRRTTVYPLNTVTNGSKTFGRINRVVVLLGYRCRLTFSWDKCGREAKTGTKFFSCQRVTDTCGWGVEEKEESIVLLITFKALK